MLPICQRGGVCPCTVNGENLALDEELAEDVQLLQITLAIHDATQDPQALKEPFEQMGIYKDTLSHFEIIKTWNQYRSANNRTTDN